MRSLDTIVRSNGGRVVRRLTALCTGLTVALAGASALAVPAEPGLRELPLDARGAVFLGEVIGDEAFDYVKTEDGIVAVLDPASGEYHVASVVQDATGASMLVPSGTPLASLTTYGGRVPPSALPEISDDTLAAIWEEADSHIPSLPIAAGPTITTATQRPLLTIFVEFTQGTIGDISLPGAFTGLLTTDINQWKQTIYGSLPGSVNHYYNDMSRGQFSFSPAMETQGTANDGVVRIRLPAPHPNSKKNYEFLQIYLKEAIARAAQYVDFASYDTDNDGVIRGDELQLLFVVAGYEAANTGKTPSIWAHAKGFYVPPSVAGKTIPGYVTVGELQRHNINGTLTEVPATMGVMAHELGHAIGLPDLYKPPTKLGDFCLMAGGSWGRRDGEPSGTTPVAMSAWARARVGFITPIEIEPGSMSSIVVAQTAGTEFLNIPVEPTVFKIKTSNPLYYFLIDNRQNAGYDQGLQHTSGFFDKIPGGLAIYRINELLPTNAGRVAMMADNSASPSGVDELYSEDTGKTFSPLSDPSSDDPNGMFTGVTVRDISAAGPLMIATVSYAPFDCNEITATIQEHELHGRAHKLVADNIFLGYITTGMGQQLGVNPKAVVTLHNEAPGMWTTGSCP